MIEWILQKVVSRIWVIRDHARKSFSNLKGQDAEVYHAIPTQEKNFNAEWATTHVVPILETLRGWWEDPEKFKFTKDQEYKTTGLKGVYNLVAVMLCRMYGRQDATTFNGTWVSLMYIVTTYGTGFN